MSHDILGSLVRVLTTVPISRLGLLLDTARKMTLGDIQGAKWEHSLLCFLRKKPCWTLDSNFVIPWFSMEVKEHDFVVDEYFCSGITIQDIPVHLGEEFKTRFSGMVEQVEAGTIHSFKFLAAFEGFHVSDVVGSDRERVYLSDVWRVLHDGDIYSYLFRVRAVNGCMVLVEAKYRDKQWFVNISSHYEEGRNEDSIICTR